MFVVVVVVVVIVVDFPLKFSTRTHGITFHYNTQDNGDHYDGEWLDDLMHGQGFYTYANGETYKGSYAFGKRDGIGKADYLDGSINQGLWKEDNFLGKKFKPDYEYVGEYNMTLGSHLYAKKNGHGKKVWKDGTGRMYDGHWEGDMMGRTCTAMVNFDGPGSCYIGQLLPDGIKHGQGKLTYPNGDFYDGQWEKNKKHGNGKYFYAKTGEVYTGKWFNNRSMRRGGP